MDWPTVILATLGIIFLVIGEAFMVGVYFGMSAFFVFVLLFSVPSGLFKVASVAVFLYLLYRAWNPTRYSAIWKKK